MLTEREAYLVALTIKATLDQAILHLSETAPGRTITACGLLNHGLMEAEQCLKM